ncbi:anthranilate synthase component I family protein [Flavisolibacter ginsenosidimutans]|uniref:Anthranilate synthase component I family protein n=1 Tax=Flavisolibacter ginsenosidimutans TaxID=661481 RepID=A0A5B8UPC7_9BACT|nr:anthranilate synthase component I family protein [Flavisolibacter ginsenosidimutans]QEC58089.1 anthranilate synthase component I family protein [Flavisolibacter ginsenosidimutans]
MDTTLNQCSYKLTDVPAFKKKVLNWLKPFGIFCYLDNQEYNNAPHRLECLVAAGVSDSAEGIDIKDADDFFSKKRWLFGHLAYELRRSLYPLTSHKEDKIGFPLFYFFEPQIVLEIKQEHLFVHASNPAKIFADIIHCPSITEGENFALPIAPKGLLSKEDYIEKIRSLQEHILRGDCYEINFCQAFFDYEASIDPFTVFQKLMGVSPNPFSAFYRLHDKYLLCASPERFLMKQKNHLVSQPIKGTIKRELISVEKDEELKKKLRESPKEQAENVMVVDLVRNDLTRICKESSVAVDELFGTYTFPQVHQMISTVSGELKNGSSFTKIVEAMFPMGSMTGAPKHRVMQLIDEYEPSARGIFSGAVGYINPDGDFDLAVVIRSLMYNQTKKILSYQVGSGITFYSDAQKEWEECMLKAEAIQRVLEM